MANVKATDLIDFTRASKGHALAKVSYGEELVTNGTFTDNIDGWTKVGDAASTISYSAGKIEADAATTLDGALQSFATVVGKVYYATADIALGTSNQARLVTQPTEDFTLTTTDKTVSLVFVATSATTTIRVDSYAGTGTFTADNISVKEVTFDQPNGTLQLFEHPQGIPRIEYDADGNLLGLLIEESRTNLITYSEDFSNAAWTKYGASVVASTTTAPDGFTTPYEIVENSGAATQHRIVDSISISSGVTYTASVYVKRGTGSRQFGILNVLGGSRVYFNLDTGTVATETLGSGKIEDVGGGWYRCSSTGVSTSTSTAFYLALCDGTTTGSETYDGDGLSSLVIYGAQLEAGAFPTSYIKTTGSTATRSADVASIPVSDFGYNQNEGTLFVEAQMFIKDVSYKAIANLNTDGSNRIRIISSSSVNVIQAEITNGGTAQLSISETIPESSLFSGAIAYKQNDSSSSVNGSVETTDTACTIPAVTKLDIMTGNSGHIKSIKYIPKRLSNAKLQELTS